MAVWTTVGSCPRRHSRSSNSAFSIRLWLAEAMEEEGGGEPENRWRASRREAGTAAVLSSWAGPVAPLPPPLIPPFAFAFPFVFPPLAGEAVLLRVTSGMTEAFSEDASK